MIIEELKFNLNQRWIRFVEYQEETSYRVIFLGLRQRPFALFPLFSWRPDTGDRKHVDFLVDFESRRYLLVDCWGIFVEDENYKIKQLSMKIFNEAERLFMETIT